MGSGPKYIRHSALLARGWPSAEIDDLLRKARFTHPGNDEYWYPLAFVRQVERVEPVIRRSRIQAKRAAKMAAIDRLGVSDAEEAPKSQLLTLENVPADKLATIRWCHYCLKPHDASEMTIDHIIPRAWGGRDVWTNYVMACSKCNQEKGDDAPTCRCPTCLNAITEHWAFLEAHPEQAGYQRTWAEAYLSQ